MKNFTDSRPFKRTNRGRTLGSVLFFLALPLVFLACTPLAPPKNDDEKKVALQDWVRAVNSFPDLVAGSTFGGSAGGRGTQIELTFDRELASVDSTKIVITLAKKFTDSDGIEKLGILLFQPSTDQINNLNKRKVELKDLTLTRAGAVDVNDNTKDVSVQSQTPFLNAFPGISISSGTWPNVRLSGLPQLTKGQTLSLLLGAGALTDKNKNQNELQTSSLFAKTIQ